MKLSREKLFEYIQSAVYAAVTFLFLYAFLWPVSIEGVSMEPALESGDRVFISRVLCMAGFYNKGDIVVLRAHYDPDKKYIVKRIAALPGDKVMVENGKIFINGEEVTSDYVNGNLDITLGGEEYFVLGDNREHSLDSRSFGPLNKNDIEGKIILRWYPFNSIRGY